MNLPDGVKAVLSRLENNGFEAYIVGGCVRDMLMGRIPDDYDITTSSLPEQTAEIFSDCKLLSYGAKHGTVTVMYDGMPLEITTFRREGEYIDSRRPNVVYFDATLEQDLSRRDFTCNAMAYSPQKGLIDIFGGREDINGGIIRAVGRAEERFSEDALRILRALRFASVLDFEIEENTAAAAIKCGPLLDNISGERKCAELFKLLCGKGFTRIIREHTEVIANVIPGIMRMKGYDQNNHNHVHTLLEHTLLVAENVPSVPYMRLAALLHDIGKPDCCTTDEYGVSHFYGHPDKSLIHAERLLNRLKCDNFTRNRVLELIKYHDVRFEPNEKTILRWLNKVGEDMLNDIFAIQRADILAQNPDYFFRLDKLEECRDIAEKAIEEKKCCSVGMLAINGNDLMKMGVPQGMKIGEVLQRLLDEVVDGITENNKSALLQRANDILNE